MPCEYLSKEGKPMKSICPAHQKMDELGGRLVSDLILATEILEVAVLPNKVLALAQKIIRGEAKSDRAFAYITEAGRVAMTVTMPKDFNEFNAVIWKVFHLGRNYQSELESKVKEPA